MRRQEKALSNEEALEILQQGEYGILSTVAQDGTPYGVPLNYCVIENTLYFHCATEGKKLDNISHANRVSFCVVGATEVLPDLFSTNFESCIVEGEAREVEGSEKQAALEGLISKYSSAFMDEGLAYIRKSGHKTRVFSIIPEVISGKKSNRRQP